jgi:WD40 repeat protein
VGPGDQPEASRDDLPATWRTTEGEPLAPEPEPAPEPAPAATPTPGGGQIGRFRLGQLLGEGAYGRVFLAFDTLLDREVALKLLRFASSEPRHVDRFEREARAAARLHHPHIVAVFESGRADGENFIASEYVPGQPLSARLATDPPALEQAVTWIAELAEALAYAHGEGVVHRDIKPDNIMIGAGERPRLMDFGLAKRVDEDNTLTTDGNPLGTPAYMSPEQARGDLKQVGPPSDQYSLGVVLYEMITGQKPFDGPPLSVIAQLATQDVPPPRAIRPGLSKDLEAICLKALDRDPSRRYPDAAALAEDLRRWLRLEPTSARPVNLVDRGLRWCRREPAQAVALGTVAAALLVIGVAGVVFSSYLAVRNALLAEANTRFQHERDVTTRLQEEAKVINELLRQKNQALTDEQEKLRIVNQGLEQRIQDEVGKRKAEAEQRGRAEGVRKQISARLAGNYLESGIKAFQDRRADLGMLWLTEALQENVFADDKQLERIARLNLRGWSMVPLPHLTSVLAHPEQVTAMACSADGATVLTGCLDGKARLWDVRTGKTVGKALEHPRAVLAVALGPQSLAATGCEDGQLRIWDRAGGAPVASLTRPQPIHLVAISPSGKFVAAACKDGTIWLWDVAKKAPPRQPLNLGHPSTVHVLAFRGGVETLMAGCDDGKIRSWSTGAGQTELRALESGSPVLTAVVDASGERLWSGHADGQQRTWNPKSTKQPLSQEASESGVTAMDVGFAAAGAGDHRQVFGRVGGSRLGVGFTAGEAAVLVGNRTGEIHLIANATRARGLVRRRDDVKTADPICLQKGEVKAVAWLTPGRRFVTCGVDHLVRVWDVQSEPRPRATLGLPSPGLRLNDHDTKAPFAHDGGVAFSADGKVLIAGNGLWNAQTGAPLGVTLPTVPSAPLTQVAVTRDGQLALIARRDVDALELWDVKGRAPIDRLQGLGPVGSFVYHARTHTVLVGYTSPARQEFTKSGAVSRRGPGQAWLWSLEPRAKLEPALKIDSDLRSLAVSPDGQWLAASGQHQVRVWSRGNPTPHLEKPLDAIAIEFLPVGETLAVIPNQYPLEVWFWDVRGKKRVGPMIGISPAVSRTEDSRRNPDRFHTLRFTPDGKTLAAGFTSSVGFWDVDTGKPIGPPILPEPDRGFTAAAISPDGLTLAILEGDRESALELWDMPAPIGGSLEQIRTWCQVSANAELDESHVIRPLEAAQWEARARALEAIGKPSDLPSSEPASAEPGNEKPSTRARRLVRGSTAGAALNPANDLAASPADWKAILTDQGRQHANAGEWMKAADAFERARKLYPQDTQVARLAALLALRGGDAESQTAYRTICGEVYKIWYSGPGDLFANLACTAAIGVNSGISPAQVLDIAFRGAQAAEFKNAYHQHVLALAYLRAGNLEQASAILMKEEGNPEWFPQINEILHAIVLHHAGNAKAARVRYARAHDWYQGERKARRWVTHFWWDQVEYEILQREAEELLGKALAPAVTNRRTAVAKDPGKAAAVPTEAPRENAPPSDGPARP